MFYCHDLRIYVIVKRKQVDYLLFVFEKQVVEYHFPSFDNKPVATFQQAHCLGVVLTRMKSRNRQHP